MTRVYAGILLRWGTLKEWVAGREAEYKAWYLIPLLVLLSLGATVALGALAWCMAHGQNLGIIINRGAGMYGVKCVAR